MKPVGGKSADPLLPSDAGWWFQSWGAAAVLAGITDRTTQRPSFLAHAQAEGVAEGEQVHGAGIAVVGHTRFAQQLIAGCDALITHQPGIALLVRTADCLPIFFVHPKRKVVALAHAGWRGLALQLPVRVLANFWNLYRCSADTVEVAIGPAIRACCYQVGPEFKKLFGPAVVTRGGRQVCDLIAVAKKQLQEAGVARSQILDTGLCTSCGNKRWYSLRCEGSSTGRLTSLIMVKT